MWRLQRRRSSAGIADIEHTAARVPIVHARKASAHRPHRNAHGRFRLLPVEPIQNGIAYAELYLGLSGRYQSGQHPREVSLPVNDDPVHRIEVPIHPSGRIRIGPSPGPAHEPVVDIEVIVTRVPAVSVEIPCDIEMVASSFQIHHVPCVSLAGCGYPREDPRIDPAPPHQVQRCFGHTLARSAAFEQRPYSGEILWHILAVPYAVRQEVMYGQLPFEIRSGNGLREAVACLLQTGDLRL